MALERCKPSRKLYQYRVVLQTFKSVLKFVFLNIRISGPKVEV